MKTNLQRCCFEIGRAVSVLGLTTILTGCPAPKTGDKVVIRGSNTIGEELAPQLIAAYKSQNGNVEFDLESKGTGYGLGNLLVGACDIAAASRPTNQFEQHQSQSRGIELNDYVICSHSVAVVVNAANPVEKLTREQVRDVFTGAITNWTQLGGSDSPIHLYIRDPISGTHLGFQELAMEARPYAAFIDTFTNYTQIVQAVAKDANGIGYSGISVGAGAKAVAIEGISPTRETVNKGEYPYARVLRLYTNKAKETPVTRHFIDFILSEKGKQVMTDMGYVASP
jgi:phosphate transport system substrate-binding protein